MAESKRKNPIGNHWDYSECTFKWLWKGPRPEPVRHMVEDRAFHSFGRDEDVIAKAWTMPLPGGRTEAWFAHSKDDVCCADAVAFTTFQTGVVPFLAEESFGVHGVDPYFPTPAKVQAGICRLVARYSREGYQANAPVPQDDFLPGDYFIFCRSKANDGAPYRDPPRKRIDDWLAGAKGREDRVGNHINVYLGDYVEVGPDGNPVTNGGGVFQMLNGSYGKSDGAGIYVSPLGIVGDFTWELWLANDPGTEIVHCRFLAIERLFGDGLGPPLRAIAPRDQSGGPPPPAPPVDPRKDMAELWSRTASADAPYPIGQNLSWHQGVHVTLTAEEADAPQEVLAMAPGEVVAARARGRTPQGDTGFVLIRHLFSQAKNEIVDPSILYGRDGKRLPMPPGVTPFFSLAMHLDAIDEDAFGPRHGNEDVHAFPWLHAVRPLDLPKDLLPAGTPITLLAPDADEPTAWQVLGAAPISVASDVDLAASAPLEKITVAGEPYYVLPRGSSSRREVWVGRPTGKPAKGKLVFYNPRSQAVLPTGATVAEGTLLHVEGEALRVFTVDGVDYAAIDSYTAPGVRKAEAGGELTVIDDRLAVPRTATQVRIHVDALGTGDGRKLVPAAFAAPIASVADAAADADADDWTHTTLVVKGDPGPAKDPVYWLDLVPCVALAPGQREAIEQDLSSTQSRFARAADERLARGASQVAAVLTSDGDGAEWTLDADTSKLSPGTNPSVYTVVSLDSRKRLVVETAARNGALKSNAEQRLQPDGLAQATLHALAVTPGPRKVDPGRALVEIVHAVRVADADAALKQRADAVRKLNEKRQGIARDLAAGKVVDLRARFGDDPVPELRVDRSPVGRVGRIVGEPGAPAKEVGIHFEVFAGRPLLLDPAAPVAHATKKLARVPRTPWLAFEDTDAADLSAEIAEALLSELRALQPPGLDTKALDERGDAKLPLRRDEWLAFCRGNQRLLSRIVSVHESEWTTDWAKAATAARSRQAMQVEGKEDDLDRAYRALAEVGSVSFVDEDGLHDPSAFVFHHPARLIEVLRTRLQVDVAAAGDATVKFTPGTTDRATGAFTPVDESVTLKAAGGGRFSALVAVGDGKDEPPPLAGVVEVTLPSGRTSIPVEIHRGATSTVSLVEPHAQLSSYWVHQGHYAVPVSFSEGALGETTELHFLADGGRHANGAGYGRAHVTVVAHYNVKAPELAVSGPAASAPVSIERVTRQASRAASPAGQPTAWTPGSAICELDVVGRFDETGRTETLSVQVDGGDFAGRAQTITLTMRTRVIQPPFSQAAAQGTRGADVAQLQFYLAQILAADRVPCLRSDDSDRLPVTIDGNYGPDSNALREALWRFLYTYGGVDVTTNAGTTVGRDVFARFAAEPSTHEKLTNPALVDHATDLPPELDAYAKRTRAPRADKSSEWVVVDAALVRRIVEVFARGAALPFVDFTFTSTAPYIAVSPQSLVQVASDVPQAPHPRGLPWAGYHLYATAKAEAEGAKGDEDVTVEIPGKDAPYTLRHGGSSGSSLEVKLGEIAGPAGATFELVWAGGDGQPKMTATVDGGGKHTWQLSSWQVFPPRNFFQTWPKEPGRDVAVVQLALSQAPRNPDRKGAKPDDPPGFVPGKRLAPTPIDGVWTDGWRRALASYASEWHLQPRSHAVVAALLDHVTAGRAPSGG